MPAFVVTSPEGKKFRVNAPDGATPDEALEYARSQFSAASNNQGISAPQEPDTKKAQEPTALESIAVGSLKGLQNIRGTIGRGVERGLNALGLNVGENQKLDKELLDAMFTARYGKGVNLANAAELITGTGLSLATPASIAKNPASLSKLARLANTAGSAALQGATSNALTSGGEDFTEDAAEGAALGALGGLAFSGIGKGASYLVNKISDKAAKSSAIASNEIGKSGGKAFRLIEEKLRKDYPDPKDFKKALNQYFSTKGESLIERGKDSVGNLAEGAGVYPSGAKAATEFFKDKVSNASDVLKDASSRAISSSKNYYDTLDNIVEEGRKKAAPLYAEAFRSNPSVGSPLISKILRTPEGKSALSEAVKNMQNEMALVARPDPELTEIMREMVNLGKMDYSKGGVASGLKLKTLDYVKKAMDSTIDRAYKNGDAGEARRIIGLKKALVDEMDVSDASGAYVKARKTSGDYLSNKDAIEAGSNFLKDDKEIVKRYYDSFGPTERKSYKAGVIKSISDKIDNSFDGANVARLFNKSSTRDKLESILNKKEYAALMEKANSVDKIYKLRNQITGNSRTMLRSIAAQEFDTPSQEILNDIVGGGVSGTARKSLLKIISSKFSGMNDKLAGEVADILYETDAKKKYIILRNLINESKTKGDSLRSTQAAKKIAVFYKISDALANNAKYASPFLVNSLGENE